jgi:hypothetical protein
MLIRAYHLLSLLNLVGGLITFCLFLTHHGFVAVIACLILWLVYIIKDVVSSQILRDAGLV